MFASNEDTFVLFVQENRRKIKACEQEHVCERLIEAWAPEETDEEQLTCAELERTFDGELPVGRSE